MRTDIDYRLKEHRQEGFNYFYRFHTQTNDCSPDIAVETWIADDLGFDFEKRCVMALFHGATYAGPCESMFADKFPVMTSDVGPLIEFFQKEKKRLLFSPDCKYRKMVFEKFLQSVGDSIKPYGTLGKFIESCWSSGTLIKSDTLFHDNYNRLQKKCMDNWFHWGRMGHWCFAEALHRFIQAPIDPPTMEFGVTGRSHTSGWAFCINRDDLVEIETIPQKEVDKLERSATRYIEQFKELYGEKNVNFFTLETCCCNYKRQHKGSRYGGCYIDEQHTETMLMKKDWPEYTWLWDKYLEGRQAVIPSSLLFENHIGEPGNDSAEAHIKSWNGALRDFGRIPRVEAYFNKTPQQWTELENMPFGGAGSNLLELLG